MTRDKGVIAVVLQARLDSSRLPGKALLDLGGKPVVSRAMESLRAIPADRWVLACDEASRERLEPLAIASGFECVSGPKEDVLARFCIVIERTGATTVVRATGDNPFVFPDAAAESLRRFDSIRTDGSQCDYFTLTGIPHGGGVEVFDARRLTEACRLTDSPYDHEHVGPSMYAHRDAFSCVFEAAPPRWRLERARVTIDTQEDYDRARVIAGRLLSGGGSFPFPGEAVIEAWRYVEEPVLAVAALGPGTGHRRRVRGISSSLSGGFRIVEAVWDARSGSLTASVDGDIRSDGNESHAPDAEIPARASLVVVDAFRSDASLIRRLSGIGPVVTVDDGGAGRELADYALDILPGSGDGIGRANKTDPGFLPLPENRKPRASGPVESALVVAGGDNGSSLAYPVARALSSLVARVTVVDPSWASERREANVTVIGPVPDLRERLRDYDLVATHYGFTAFEALAAGASVVLFSPTRYHYRLARKAGFAAIAPGRIRRRALGKALAQATGRKGAIAGVGPDTVRKDLSAEFARLAGGVRVACPLCGSSDRKRSLARSADRTVVSCASCGMSYLSFHLPRGETYGESYFFEEYRAQYGKTYLEDFAAIKARGIERIRNIERVRTSGSGKAPSGNPSALDVGCAYGPFLEAARETGWTACGTDICAEAVAHVRDVLGIPAVRAAFPALEDAELPTPGKFDAVTMWFVIEHFDRLDPVFSRIRDLLSPGGVFAFSTPSAGGISARRNRQSFYENGPLDHYTIWNPRTVRRQLASRGFAVRRIVSTGHHPERFPFASRARPGSTLWKFLELTSRVLALGDTFEVYAVLTEGGKTRRNAGTDEKRCGGGRR